MPDFREEPRKNNASSKTIIIGWIVVLLFLVFLILLTSPLGDLLGPSEWAVASTLHGLLSVFGVIVVSVAAYLGWKLYAGRLRANGDLKLISALSVIGSLSTIIFGNWIYIGYREPDGPRSYFLANSPSVHEIFFEFKEFIALFTLPLAVASLYIIWTYRETLANDKPLRTAVAFLLITTWLIFIATFALGAAITRLRGV